MDNENGQNEGTEEAGKGKGKGGRKKKDDAETKPKVAKGTITAPKFETKLFGITGRSELVLERFSMKALAKIRLKHEMGSAGANRKGAKGPREKRNFDEDCRGACYIFDDETYGIHTSAFRAALISACGLVGLKMTMAKKTIFVEPDGIDALDGSALTKILAGPPEMFIAPVRNATGVNDLRSRPRWRPGWKMNVPVRWDTDQFTSSDVQNLLIRVGLQIGVGAGRYDSRASAGLGWGCFDVSDKAHPVPALKDMSGDIILPKDSSWMDYLDDSLDASAPAAE